MLAARVYPYQNVKIGKDMRDERRRDKIFGWSLTIEDVVSLFQEWDHQMSL